MFYICVYNVVCYVGLFVLLWVSFLSVFVMIFCNMFCNLVGVLYWCRCGVCFVGMDSRWVCIFVYFVLMVFVILDMLIIRLEFWLYLS